MLRKYISLSLLCLAGFFPAQAQQTTHAESGFVPTGYALVWSDEFDKGTELNSADWTHEVQSSGWVNHELQNYVNHKTPGGALVTEVQDDHLTIEGKRKGVLRPCLCTRENGLEVWLYRGSYKTAKRKGYMACLLDDASTFHELA